MILSAGTPSTSHGGADGDFFGGKFPISLFIIIIFEDINDILFAGLTNKERTINCEGVGERHLLYRLLLQVKSFVKSPFISERKPGLNDRFGVLIALLDLTCSVRFMISNGEYMIGIAFQVFKWLMMTSYELLYSCLIIRNYFFKTFFYSEIDTLPKSYLFFFTQ